MSYHTDGPEIANEPMDKFVSVMIPESVVQALNAIFHGDLLLLSSTVVVQVVQKSGI